MPKTCVEIEVDDQGQVTVGVCPPEQETPGEEQQDKQYMQPAQSVEEALTTAKDLLTNPQAQAAEGGQQPGGQSQNDMWNKVQRDRAMESQPGGPMMGQQ